jgi:hypothetical protein
MDILNIDTCAIDEERTFNCDEVPEFTSNRGAHGGGKAMKGGKAVPQQGVADIALPPIHGDEKNKIKKTKTSAVKATLKNRTSYTLMLGGSMGGYLLGPQAIFKSKKSSTEFSTKLIETVNQRRLELLQKPELKKRAQSLLTYHIYSRSFPKQI